MKLKMRREEILHQFGYTRAILMKVSFFLTFNASKIFKTK